VFEVKRPDLVQGALKRRLLCNSDTYLGGSAGLLDRPEVGGGLLYEEVLPVREADHAGLLGRIVLVPLVVAAGS
jgi:hypothetical protein